MLITIGNLSFAQSGNWDASGTVGTTGYTDHGNGVIQLLDTDNSNGCVAAAIHETSATYNPVTDGTFSQCYEVFFGCPGDDEIGSDTKGDGLAFSFSDCAWTVGTCGGGLGYRNACAKMITIEFDTWSSQGTAGFDSNYEGTGNDDQVAIHRDGDPEDFGKLVGANPGNLEDGLEHTVCITYEPTTDVMTVNIDGTDVLVYDMTGTGYELETYFGSVGLNQSWSSGKDGATNPATVSHGQDISDQIGSALCDEGVAITSPATGAVFGSCEAPITIESFVVPPAGNTVDSVEFYVDGTRIGVDYTEPYSHDWNNPTVGSRALQTTAYYDPSGTNSSSSVVNITVGGKIDVAGSAPTIDGTVDAFWNNYAAIPLTLGHNSAPDLAGTYKIAYDASNLYMLVEVTDDNLVDDSGNNWEDDGVEVYIDVNNDKPGAYGGDDYQYSFAYNNAPTVTEFKSGNTAGVTFAESTPAGGYTFEISFPWGILGGAPSAGDEIGFDVLVNDDDDGGGRDNQLTWYDGTFGAWNNPSLFGTQEFTDCDPLPVELLSFTGELVNDIVILDWATTIEINNDRFVIERSSNLTDWQVIGEVSGAGNSNSLVNYNFIDYSPLNGLSYYRLRQIDYDGTTTYTPIVAVQSKESNTYIGPNPFNESLTIYNDLEGQVSIYIYDVLGRVMYEQTWDAFQSSVTINPELAAGAYFVAVQSKSGVVFEQKIVRM